MMLAGAGQKNDGQHQLCDHEHAGQVACPDARSAAAATLLQHVVGIGAGYVQCRRQAERDGRAQPKSLR